MTPSPSPCMEAKKRSSPVASVAEQDHDQEKSVVDCTRKSTSQGNKSNAKYDINQQSESRSKGNGNKKKWKGETWSQEDVR